MRTAPPLRLLLAEDEELIGQMVALNLRREGYEVVWVKTGTEADQRGRSEPFDLLVLDAMMPGLTGFEVARRLRAAGMTLPVLMLTALGETADKVRGLDAGADDYLVKPFELAELKARVRALTRRAQGERHLPSDHVLRFGAFSVNLETHEAVTREGEVRLSEKEARLLALFFRRRGETLSRADILEEVWGMNAFPTERTVDNVIVRLRRLFEDDPDHPRRIVSVRGQGYRFTP